MSLRYDLLPRNKFDDEAVERLATLPVEELVPLAGDLLIWLQDINWPIAPAVAELLLPHVAAIESQLIEVFTGTDDVWKYWILSCLRYSTFASSTTPKLRQTLHYIATSPTPGEMAEELDQKARAFLDYLAEAEST